MPNFSFGILAKNWWPVLVWLGIIRLESTDMASAQNTSQIVYQVVAAVYPKVQPTFVQQLDEVLRKTGHFTGYAILGALVFLALRNTSRDRLREFGKRAWGSLRRDFWRIEWFVIAMAVTVITASVDEFHQTFIASRTGRWQDVVLDSCGAVVLQIVIYLLSVRAFEHGRERPMSEPLILG